MKILVIADPLEDLNPKSDTALSFTREALKRNHQVQWASAQNLRLWREHIQVQSIPLSACAEKEAPQTEAITSWQEVRDFDCVWVRKDPPFNYEYLSLCWLLGLEESAVPIINRPSTLVRYHEKMLPLEAYRQGFLQADDLIPTFLSTNEDLKAPQDFPEGPCISKPWSGHGGRDIEKWPSLSEALDTPYGPLEEISLFQPFVADVLTTGDRRVLFIQGDYVGDVVRMPPEGSIKANLVQGGIGELRPLSPREQELTKRLGAFLKQADIFFAGADYIGEKLTEVNITAPTGVETIRDLGGPDVSKVYLDQVEILVNK